MNAIVKLEPFFGMILAEEVKALMDHDVLQKGKVLGGVGWTAVAPGGLDASNHGGRQHDCVLASSVRSVTLFLAARLDECDLRRQL